MIKKINQLSKSELIELINNLFETNLQSQKVTRIRVCDIEIECSANKLDECVETINSLIDRNKDFITLRNNKLKKDSIGYLS